MATTLDRVTVDVDVVTSLELLAVGVTSARLDEGTGDWPVVVIANRVNNKLNNRICYSKGNYH